MRLELSQRLFGDSANNLDLRWGSSLSWSEHRALMASAAGSMATAQEAARVRHTLEQLRYDVQDVIEAVETLQTEIGLQLQDQTRLMTRQVELLAEIVETLRTPARTRAAERIADAGELLRRERYERALTVAIRAVDDPNNPAGLLAAAWASLGVDDVTQARDFFREAAQASDVDQRQSALRQAARLTFLLEGPQAALNDLGDSPEQLSLKEETATDFDRAVYLSNAGESTTAAEYIRKTSYHDGRFCMMALTDPILSRDATVAQTAAEQLEQLSAIQEEVPTAAELRQAHARYEALCKEIEHLGLAEAVWKWRERREKEWQNILHVQLPELPYCGLNALLHVRNGRQAAISGVDQDEQALGERRAELVLNDALAREFAAGWRVLRRWKLHAFIARWPSFRSPQGREVWLDPRGKTLSTKVDSTNAGHQLKDFHTSAGVVNVDLPRDLGSKYGRQAAYSPCEYCRCRKDPSGTCAARCGGPIGELELFS